MYRKTPHFTAAVLAVVGFFTAVPASTADEANIYSARHYDSDALMFDGFHKATGIRVNVINGEGPELLARLKAV